MEDQQREGHQEGEQAEYQGTGRGATEKGIHGIVFYTGKTCGHGQALPGAWHL